jgi:zinc/manganese transport system ATP-binding protein
MVGSVVTLMDLVRFHDVTIAYNRHPAVRRLTGAFASGTLTAVAGPNGAGKSTLLKCIMGELPIAGGLIQRQGLSVRDIGYLPQVAEIDRRFPLTVSDVVILGAWRQAGSFRAISTESAKKAGEALSAVGLDGFASRQIGSLSVGQFQRVLFARLLVQDAAMILLDEPFSAIDARTTRDLLALVQNWHQEGRTVVAVLHDFEQVRAHFPQTLLLAREPVAWGATDTIMTEANLSKARNMAEQWDTGRIS